MAIVPRRDRTAVTTTTAAIGTATPIITGTPAGTHTGSTAIKGTVGIIVTVITMDTEAGHATTPVGTRPQPPAVGGCDARWIARVGAAGSQEPGGAGSSAISNSSGQFFPVTNRRPCPGS